MAYSHKREYWHWVGFPTTNTPSAHNRMPPQVFVAKLFHPSEQNRKRKLRRNVLCYGISIILQNDIGKDLKSELINAKPEHNSSKHTFLVPPSHQSHLQKPCKMLSGKARKAKSSRSYRIREDE